MTDSLKAFISAPAAEDLGDLPNVLEARKIDWEWANSPATSGMSSADAIDRADLFLGVLSGTREDRRILFEAGVAAGLRKRILMLRTTSKVWPSDVPGIKSVRLRLNDIEALDLHIRALVSSPTDSIFQRSVHPDVKPSNIVVPEQRPVSRGYSFEAQVVAQLADAIARAGGAVVHEPQGDADSAKFRPDMLVWLGHQDPELLDPALLEIRRKLDPDKFRTLEDRMVRYMHATGVRSSIVICDSDVVPFLRVRWPNIFVLGTKKFEQLVNDGALGGYLREERNRARHAAS